MDRTQFDNLVVAVRTRRDIYPTSFAAWFAQNHLVVEAFFETADLTRDQGRTHYSARTIWEYLRHHSNIVQASGVAHLGEWKLPDHAIPYMARIYMKARDCHGFFSLRSTELERAAA